MTGGLRLLAVCGPMLVLAACGTGPTLNSGESIRFADSLQRSCTDDPVTAPLPFRPASIVGRGRGIVEIRVRYAVTSAGRVENAQVTYVAISEDSPPLSAGQLADIQSEIPEQIEDSWRYEAGSFRACERRLMWRTS